VQLTGATLVTREEISRLKLNRAECAPGRTARHWLTSVLRDNQIPNNLADDILSVAYELVENALQHGGTAPTILISLYWWNGLLVEVHDSSNDHPVPGVQDSTTESGRGLLMVQMIATRWGWYPQPEGGKVVWALFALPTHNSGAFPS
jgi:anti-sigma regulatory factor (Ser/Thr protein kinase)